MYPTVIPPPLAPAQATQPQNRKRKRTNAALPADLTNTQTAQLQQPPPIPTIQSPPLEIMRYIHAQLRLRADVFDEFHMLMWRHLLSNDIPRLEELARIVNPHMGSIPADLCPAIVSFLRTYGPRLWRSSTRSHLTTSPTRLSGQGYWQPIRGTASSSRPEYHLDRTMTGPTLKKWLKNAPSNTAAPSPEESALHSPLGQLLRVYMFAALNLSTVNESYEKAITLREKDLFHQILVADEDAVQQDPFLSDADCVKVQHYLSLTGDMGGLP